MNIKRAILAGIQVWGILFSLFTLSSFVPVLEDPVLQENLVLTLSLIPLALIGAAYYYRKGNQGSGLMVGLTMVLTALLLDALITVPFVLMPIGGSYIEFFTSAILWIVVTEYLFLVFVYSKFRATSQVK